MADRIHDLPLGRFSIHPAGTPLAAARSMLASLGATFRQWRRRMREREQLARFSDLELHDVGVTRADALTELAKPFWRA